MLVACLFLRLSPDKRQVLILNLTLHTATLFVYIHVYITVSVGYNLAQRWIVIQAQCTSLARSFMLSPTNIDTVQLFCWQVVLVFNIITEVALFSTFISRASIVY
jgi:hypothetical protein